MAVTQISKILLRRGAQNEVGVNSLDAGEMGFATDTGRLFIGTDPVITGPWDNRTILPYEAVEVLTETSLETFARLHDRMARMVGPVGVAEANTVRRSFNEATLQGSVLSFQTMSIAQYDVNGQAQSASADMVLARTKSMSAKIEYTLFNGSDVVRSGLLTISHDGNLLSNVATLIDEYSVTDVDTAPDVRFRALRTGNSSNYTFFLQYSNPIGAIMKLQFRILVAAKSGS